MEKLIEKHYQILRDVPTDYIRNFSASIHWQERLIGIKGAKGVGKTTLILQHIKKSLSGIKSIYLTLDDPYFFLNNLTDTIADFIKTGFTHFFIDEVHKYPNWSGEIKNLYDTYRNIFIVFSGSSVLHLTKGTADLSRRAMVYDLPGLSFREYLELITGKKLKAHSLEEIINSHVEIALSLTEKIKPFVYFSEYLKKGYYPFFLETPETYNLRLESAINQSLENDLTLANNISQDVVIKLKRILGVIAKSAPFKPNIQKISQRVEVSRNSLIIYIRYLEDAKIIKQLFSYVEGIGALQKPQKIYFENSNLIYSLTDLYQNIGTLRETFVLNQLSQSNTVSYPKAGDFMVNKKYTFEVGGKNKSNRQLKNIKESFIISDNIEVGFQNKIPIWLFGFLY